MKIEELYSKLKWIVAIEELPEGLERGTGVNEYGECLRWYE